MQIVANNSASDSSFLRRLFEKLQVSSRTVSPKPPHAYGSLRSLAMNFCSGHMPEKDTCQCPATKRCDLTRLTNCNVSRRYQLQRPQDHSELLNLKTTNDGEESRIIMHLAPAGSCGSSCSGLQYPGCHITIFATTAPIASRSGASTKNWKQQCR